MTSEEDQVIIDALRNGLEEVRVPESLHPDAVRRSLLAIEAAEDAGAARAAEKSGRAAGGHAERLSVMQKARRGSGTPRFLLAAASVALAAGVGLWAFSGFLGAKQGAVDSLSASIMGGARSLDVRDILTDEVRDDLFSVEKAAHQPGLATASSYGEIRASLLAFEAQQAAYYEDVAKAENEAMVDIAGDVRTDSAPAAGLQAETAATATQDGGAKTADFSDTNVRTEGVGEADVVKTDGRYLYVLQDDCRSIAVVDAQGGRMKVLGRAQVEEGVQISEFYVDGDRLFALSTEYRSSSSGGEFSYEPPVTRLDAFDLSDPESPRLQSSAAQSGTYASSRFVDGFVYVFSHYAVYDVASSDDPSSYVPCVGEKAMACTDVYLPPNVAANQYLVAVAYSAQDPGSSVSQKAVLSDYGQLYVSADNIYVYETVGGASYDIMPIARSLEDAEGQIDPQSDGADGASEPAEDWAPASPEEGPDSGGDSALRTSIRKLSFKEGQLEGVAQTKVDGTLDSSWCIDEYDGYLRLVATLYDEGYDTVNAVYVLDDKLEQVGSIEGLAQDERVYSARLMGNTGYFVTFRETDPLFSVDFSDPENPQIVGSLKIPGFSEYLHPYGEGLLLGIGMQADEDTGVTDGLKLSMFDVSDPTAVTEVAKAVVEGCYYADVFNDYRAVLIDQPNNVIGFSGYDDGRQTYFVYSYDDGVFTQDMAEDVNGNSWMSPRGVRIGEVLYVVNGNAVESYAIGSYEKIDDLLI